MDCCHVMLGMKGAAVLEAADCEFQLHGSAIKHLTQADLMC